MRVALDLFCGTGGATAAFRGRPELELNGHAAAAPASREPAAWPVLDRDQS